MRVISWNVNGLRACHRKGFLRYLDSCDAEVLGLQEVRADADKLVAELLEPTGWHVHMVAAERPGYSGVALYSRRVPDTIETSLGLSLIHI